MSEMEPRHRNPWTSPTRSTITRTTPRVTDTGWGTARRIWRMANRVSERTSRAPSRIRLPMKSAMASSPSTLNPDSSCILLSRRSSFCHPFDHHTTIMDPTPAATTRTRQAQSLIWAEGSERRNDRINALSPLPMP